jgi:hypothetical protein
LDTRSRGRPGYLDSLDDAVDLCFAFNLHAASQQFDGASPEEVFLETHLTFDVVCQATVDLRAPAGHELLLQERKAGRLMMLDLPYDLVAHARHVFSLQFWHSNTD